MSRLFGIILVLLGGLTLGYREVESSIRHTDSVEAGSLEGSTEPWWEPSPVAGGIAIVSGLLLLASRGEGEEN
jgi:hypothetical protein